MKALLVVLLTLCAAPLQALTFEQVKMLYERRLGEIEAAETEARTKLRDSYTGEMQELFDILTKRGDLDGALIVKGEMERIAKGEAGEEPAFNGGKVPRLLSLRGKFDRSREDITRQTLRDRQEAEQKYLNLLDEQVVELTRQRKLEDAVKVREEAERLRKMIAERDGAEEETESDKDVSKEILEAIAGTTWTWEVRGHKDQSVKFLEDGSAKFSWTNTPAALRIANDGGLEIEGGDWKERGIKPHQIVFDLGRNSYKCLLDGKVEIRGQKIDR